MVLRSALLALIVAVGALVTACGSSSKDVTVVRFWAMGREGEVVAALLPEFERDHPGIRVDVQSLPWTAAHEKLLTAFAGDATPDICQLGNTWIPEFVALRALEPLDRYVASSPVVDPGDYFSGILETNRVDGELYGVPWYVDTRLLFYRRDLLAQAGFAEPPRSWSEWSRALAAIKQRAGPGRYAILLPLNEFEPLLALSLQQAEPLLRDGGRWGNFGSVDFRRTLTFYLEMYRNGWAPARTSTDVSNVWNEFGRGQYSFYISGPWNIGEFKRRLPPDEQGNWMTAALPGPDGPGCIDRGRLEPGALPQRAVEGRGVAIDRVSLPTFRPAPISRNDRRSAAPPRDVARRRPPDRCVRACLSRPARARQTRTQGSGMGTHRDRVAPRYRARGAR